MMSLEGAPLSSRARGSWRPRRQAIPRPRGTARLAGTTACLLGLFACGGHAGSSSGSGDAGNNGGGTAVGNNPCNVSEPTIQAGTTAGMMHVPSGTFWRGCNSTLDAHCAADESPGACVTLGDFQISETEVTQTDYDQCVIAGACATPSCNFSPKTTPNAPVACVTWAQANTYCQWLTNDVGALPTEAEWEMAARGTDGRVYPWGEATPACALANLDGCGGMAQNAGTTVGDVSAYGLNDMGGNLREWVSDWYGAQYYATAPAADPSGPASGSERVQRGGSFDSPGPDARTSARFEADPGSASPDVGFRCVMPGA